MPGAERRRQDGSRGEDRTRGFTAPEMLVVIFIISLLLALIVVAVRGVRRGAQEKATRSIITALEAACDAYFDAWNHYPPDDESYLPLAARIRHQELRDQGDTDLARTVTGSECLVIALGSKKLGGPFYTEMHTKQMCDLDGDATESAGFTLMEFADGWGKPIRYENLGDTVGVRLWSAGRDMLFGTDDDYKNR